MDQRIEPMAAWREVCWHPQLGNACWTAGISGVAVSVARKGQWIEGFVRTDEVCSFLIDGEPFPGNLSALDMARKHVFEYVQKNLPALMPASTMPTAPVAAGGGCRCIVGNNPTKYCMNPPIAWEGIDGVRCAMHRYGHVSFMGATLPPSALPGKLPRKLRRLVGRFIVQTQSRASIPNPEQRTEARLLCSSSKRKTPRVRKMQRGFFNPTTQKHCAIWVLA